MNDDWVEYVLISIEVGAGVVAIVMATLLIVGR